MSIFQRPFGRFAHTSPFFGLANELQREMSAAQPARLRSNSAGVYPPVNLHETESGYVLTAELPGVSTDDIDIQIEGATVTLSGQRKSESVAGEGVAVHRRERQSGTFRRAFELPAEIDFEAARAVHKNGVLTLELPKSAAMQPRLIEIETR